MRILVVGWDPEWVEHFSEITKGLHPDLIVDGVHHKTLSEPGQHQVLYSRWTTREGSIYIAEEPFRYISLITKLIGYLRWGVGYDLICLGTDCGYRRALEVFRIIRMYPRYQDTPVFAINQSSRNDFHALLSAGSHDFRFCINEEVRAKFGKYAGYP